GGPARRVPLLYQSDSPPHDVAASSERERSGYRPRFGTAAGRFPDVGTRGVNRIPASAALLRHYGPARRTAEAAPDGDGLRVRWPGELDGVLSAARVCQRADQLIRRRHKDLERGARAGAGRLDPQLL